MASKYDMRSNPVYQIDFANAASGKRLSATKRRVRFRFGFSNRDAIAKGLTGVECRGEEHEVSLVWSLTSGKRLVIFDGKEVHFSMGRRADAKFEASWSIQGGHMLKIIAHAAPPLRATPGFKQFDLILDGFSYFDMPSIFELGVQRQHGRSVATAVMPRSLEYGSVYKNSAMNRYEEERGMRSYSSLEADPQSFAGPPRRTFAEAAPVASASNSVPSVAPKDVLSDAPPAPSDLLQATSPVIVNTVDEFTPVEAQPMPPTFQDVSSHILSAYGPPPPTPAAPAPLALANESHTHYTPHMQHVPTTYSPNAAYPEQQQTYFQGQPTLVSPDGSGGSGGSYTPSQAPPATPQKQALAVGANAPQQFATPMVTPTMTMMKPLDVDELRDSPPPVDAMDQAVQNLVNLSDLMETKATPEQIKAKKHKEASKTHHKSVAKPPTATTWHVGQNASLGDLQCHKTPKTPTKEVMRTHAFDPAAAQAGMLVVYGQQAPQQGAYGGGIPTATGFGVGVHRGYAQPYPVRAAY